MFTSLSLLLGVAAADASPRQPVPHAQLSGSPYEIGQQTARQFRTQIAQAINQLNQSGIFEFSFDGAGAEAYSNLSWTVKTDFPDAYAIIQGMSDELIVELDVVMMMNVYVSRAHACRLASVQPPGAPPRPPPTPPTWRRLSFGRLRVQEPPDTADRCLRSQLLLRRWK